MRVFIAIELEDKLKDYIEGIQKIVKSHSFKGNFSRRENFHLTLRFIGEANYAEIIRIKRAIDDTATKFQSFSLKLGDLGYFPRKNKKIVWIGISKGHRELRNLFCELESNLERHGFAREERGLKPHITIGREVRLKTDFKDLLNFLKIEEKIIPVKKISLMESTRIDGNLTYVPIYVKSFNK